MTLINKLVIGASCAAATFVFGALMWLKISNLHLQAQVVEAQIQLVAFRMANDSLAGEIKKQNAAFARLQTEVDKRRELAEAAAKEAKGRARKYLDEAESFRRLTASGDACAAADNLFNAYLTRSK